MVAKLLYELPIEVPSTLIDKAKVLDMYYIPSRHPNVFPEGAPFEHFGKLQAEEAIKHASEIIEFICFKMGVKRGS